MLEAREEEYTNNHNDERVSFTPSGFFGDSAENIVEIENFMTPEELEILNSFARKNTLWDITETHYNEEGTVIYDSSYWEDRVATATTLDKADPVITKTIIGMQSRLKEKVDAFFSVDAKATSPAVVRWLPGQLQMPHADKELHEGEHRGKPNEIGRAHV